MKRGWPQPGRDWSTGWVLLSDWLQWISCIPTNLIGGKISRTRKWRFVSKYNSLFDCCNNSLLRFNLVSQSRQLFLVGLAMADHLLLQSRLQWNTNRLNYIFYKTANTVQKTREDSALPSNWILRNVQYKMTNEEFKGINDFCEKNSTLHLGKTNKLLISWRYTIKTHICALPVDRTEVKSSTIRINHICNLFLAFSTIWNRYFRPPGFDLNTILPSKKSKNRVTVQQSKNFWAAYPPLSLTDLGFSSTNWKNQQKKNNQWNSTSILSKIIRIIKRSSHYNKSKSHSFFLSSVELQLENNWTAITMPMRTLMNR